MNIANRDSIDSNITFVFHDVEGGVATMNSQIIAKGDFSKDFKVHVVLWKTLEDSSKTFNEKIPNVDKVTRFRFSKYDNYSRTLKRLNCLINSRPGIIISNDGIELQSVQWFGTHSTIFAIVHDFYNLRLCVNYLNIIDHFICHTETYAKALLSASSLESRVSYLPHGVNILENKEICLKSANLKIVSISRLVKSKGVLDLRAVDVLLRNRGIQVNWLILGSGELDVELKRQWVGIQNVAFLNPDSSSEVLRIAQSADIFISPSSFEGYGIALLEAMSCGLVPIIYKLPIGIYSLVPETVGYSVAVGDIEGLAVSIHQLHVDRELLKTKSAKAREFVLRNYNIDVTAPRYREVISSHWKPSVGKGVIMRQTRPFGIFDRIWIPNWISKIFKKLKSNLMLLCSL